MRAGGGKKEQKQALMHCYILSGSITHANPRGKTPPYTQYQLTHAGENVYSIAACQQI